MKTRIPRAPLAVISLAVSALHAFPSLAQSGAGTLPATVVTATRTEQPLTDLVADVTVIDRAAIERSGATGVGDVLARVPGIEMGRNGGAGNTTNLYLRGAETQLTAVYIDGMRVDSQYLSGGASWENIPLAAIDRIEVLRGPGSAVYGSDAIGGVIQIFTRKGEQGFAPYAGAGFGTYGTRRWETGFSGADGSVDYSFGLARSASNGFSARPHGSYHPDDDGYANEAVNARLGWQLAPAHRLEAVMLSSKLDAQYDGSSTNFRTDDRNLNLLQSRGLNWRANWSDRYSTLVSVNETRNQYETTGVSASFALTRLNGYLFQNEWRLGAHQFTATLENRTDRLETSPVYRNRAQDGVALGYGWNQGGHTVQLNVRHDQDSEFGGQDTGSAAYGFAFTPRWRFTAAAATAFRAPTLFQRFSKYGLSTLQPQTSRNVEAGVRRTEGAGSWGLVAYRNTVTNLIDSVSGSGPCSNGTSCYANVPQAEYIGVTLSGEQAVGNARLHASLDVQDPRDQGTGKLLRRRANQHATMGVSMPLAGWSLGADAQLSGVRYSDAANTEYLAGYTLLNLHAQKRVGKDWTLLLRVDNATDANYQLVKDYLTPGRTLFVGMRWAPQQ